jgi:hypothetical protein
MIKEENEGLKDDFENLENKVYCYFLIYVIV